MATRDSEMVRDPQTGLSIFRRGAVLILFLLLLEVPIGATAFFIEGTGGLWASLVAMIACGVGGLLALVLCDLLAVTLRDELVAFAQAVSGMLGRAAIGLGVCAIGYGLALPVSESGLAFYVLAFYMLTLAVETAFLVQEFGRSAGAVSSGMEK